MICQKLKDFAVNKVDRIEPSRYKYTYSFDFEKESFGLEDGSLIWEMEIDTLKPHLDIAIGFDN